MTTRSLAAFDFDNTIVADNSDLVVQKLLPCEIIPKYKDNAINGWTSHMQNIFELFHQQNIDQSKIEECLNQIEPNCGFKELIENLAEKYNYDIIIVSDANTHFINTWLIQNKLHKYVTQIFTNPAEFQNGLLKIQCYENQESCNLCARNICKGQVLEDFIDLKDKEGVKYDKVVYVGDGLNDFCPILRLNSSDLACCREGYKCARLVTEAKEGKTHKNETHHVKADVVMWTSGFQILDYIQNQLKIIN